MKKNIAIVLLALGMVSSFVFAQSQRLETERLTQESIECNQRVQEAQLIAERSSRLAEEQAQLAEVAMMQAQLALQEALEAAQ